MDNALNIIQNNALARKTAQAPYAVMASIAQASARTGTNFAYLLQQASAESAYNPAAKAKGSSASGLYQFIGSTWIDMVKKYGDKYGMGDLASHIDANGHVDSRAVKAQILALRNDPEKAAAMAGEFANENKQYLQSEWGGKVGSTELYLAHFLGAGQAAGFLKARDDNPLQPAAVLFPKAAAANRNVFYDTATGRPKSVGEIYAFFDKKFDIKTDSLPQIAEAALRENPDPSGSAAQYASLNMGGTSAVFTKPESQNFANWGAIKGNYFNIGSATNNLTSDPVEIMRLSALAGTRNDKKSRFMD